MPSPEGLTPAELPLSSMTRGLLCMQNLWDLDQYT